MKREVHGRWGVGRRLRLATVLIAVLALAGLGPRDAGPMLAATATPTAKTVPGWPGGLKSYQGRYKLITSSDAAFAKSGELTIFGRTVRGLKGLQLSGILSLYNSTGTSVLYLTHFGHMGSKLSAVINAGLYTGPVIGKFDLVTRKGAAMAAVIVPGHGAEIRLRFSEISNNPQP